MTEESSPRIDERPSTHKKKMQAYLMAALGVVFFVLLFMVVWNVYSKMQERKAPPKEADATPLAAPPTADRQTQFDALAQNRTARPTTQGEAGSTNELFDKISEGMTPAQRRSAASGRGAQAVEPEESVESKEVRQWKSREELRALKAANKDWGLPKATKTGQGALSMTPGSPGSRSDVQAAPANMNDQIAHLNRPMNENASLDERRAEVKRRIAEAQQLRLSLQQNGAAGLPEAAGRPGATSSAPGSAPPMLSPQMAPAAPQRAQAPANVVGYPKKNQYDADTAGKIKVPPGTEILTTLMKKGISDYPGTSLKAIANRDVYDTTRQFVIIPKGTEFNIKMVRTRNVNEAISNRVGFLVKEAVLPNGNSIDFSTAAVADREGVGAIEDQTDYHLVAQFLGVAAYALIGSQTSRSGTGDDEGSYAGDVGENSRSQFAPLAEKYLNIVPTQTIRPGQSFQIVTEQEMFIEPWSDLYAKYVD